MTELSLSTVLVRIRLGPLLPFLLSLNSTSNSYADALILYRLLQIFFNKSYVVLMVHTGDPWRDTTMSAKSQSPHVNALQQVYLTQGFHCSDLTLDTALDPTIVEVQRRTVQAMKIWLRSYRPRTRPIGLPVQKPPRPSPWRPRPPTGPKKNRKVVNAWMKGFGEF